MNSNRYGDVRRARHAGEARRVPRWTLGFLLAPGALFTTAASCSSSSGLASVAAQCSINSDCNGNLICAFGRCHEQCMTSKDCTGATCLPASTGDVCELPQETKCSATLPCVSGLTCANDTCRSPCSKGVSAGAPGGCLEAQTCTALSNSTVFVCIDTSGGGMGKRDGGGTGKGDSGHGGSDATIS